MPRTVAIGIQDFAKLIKKKCFYIDKNNYSRCVRVRQELCENFIVVPETLFLFAPKHAAARNFPIAHPNTTQDPCNPRLPAR